MFARAQIKYIGIHCPLHSPAVLSPHPAVIKSHGVLDRCESTKRRRKTILCTQMESWAHIAV